MSQLLHRIYCSAQQSKRGRKRTLTATGGMVLGGLILSAILGLDMNRTYVYQLFTLLAAFFAVAFLGSLRFHTKLKVARFLPAVATVGERFTYRVRIENRLPIRQSCLFFQERATTQSPNYDELMRAREPGETRRNPWDRMVLYHRFIWLTRRNTKVAPSERALPEIGANSYIDFYADLLPQSRGYLHLSGVLIKRPDLLGLFKTAVYLENPDRMLILPRRYLLPPVRLPGARRYQPGGVNLASSVGNADEFRTLRDYRPGDPMHMLHWKSLAKTGELVIRENEDEFFVRHGLVLDTFCAQPYARRFEVAVSIAASFACSVRTQESMLDLMFVENQAYCFPAGRGVDHTGKMLEVLAEIESCPSDRFADLENLVLEHGQQLSGCICILLGWDQARQQLVESLKARGWSSLTLVVLDGEDQPAPVDQVHFIDASHPEQGLARL